MKPKILLGDNTEHLKNLRDDGAKFDLIELDGPYGAGLEDWDTLTEAEYLEHYAERLTIVRDILQPWGVVFMFGYPEYCAEVKAWAHRTGALHLRRWLHWYNNKVSHQGRFIQVVLLFTQNLSDDLVTSFRNSIKAERKKSGWTIERAHNETGIHPGCRGGYIWFESETGRLPNHNEYAILKSTFGLPDIFDKIPCFSPIESLTGIDVIRVEVESAKRLNDNGLRSKPIQLYIDLFKPTIPPTENHNALILYGGSGNAGIAAAALGYDVSICESDAARCEDIRRRWDADVSLWKRKLSQLPLPIATPKQAAIWDAPGDED